MQASKEDVSASERVGVSVDEVTAAFALEVLSDASDEGAVTAFFVRGATVVSTSTPEASSVV